MARRRGRFRARARSAGRSTRRIARRSARRGGIGRAGNLIQVDSMAYGALRPAIANFVTPFTSALPFGNLADNLALGLTTWFIAKRTKGLARNVALKGLVIENALIGGELAGNLTGQATPVTSGQIMG